MELITLNCNECRKDFHRIDYFYKHLVKIGQKRFFCSRNCANKAHSKLMSIKNPSMRKDVAKKISKGIKIWHKKINKREHGKLISEGMMKNHLDRKFICLGCKIEFVDNHRKYRLYCSTSCRNIYANPSKRPDVKKKMSERLKRLYKKYPERHPNYIIAQRKGMRKTTEKPIYELLRSLGLKPKFNYNIDGYWIDFLVEPNLCIETDGTYWHRNTQKKDRIKQNYLMAKGFKVIRFSEKQIEEDIELCKQQLLKVLSD